MKSMKLSKELVIMLAVILLLTGATYFVHPGRSVATIDNVESVSISHQRGNFGYQNFKDSETIQLAVQVMDSMKENTHLEDWNIDYSEYSHHNLRVNFKNGGSRNFSIGYPKEGTKVSLRPYKSNVSYEIDKALIDPLLDKAAPTITAQ